MYKKLITFFFLILTYGLSLNISIAYNSQGGMRETITSLKIGSGVEIKYLHGHLSEKTFIVTGDLDLANNVTIDGNLIVYGDFNAGDSLKISGHLVSTGNIQTGILTKIRGIIKGKNITTGSYFTANRVIVLGDMHTKGTVNIKNGIYIKGDFFSGSDLILSGKSKVLGNMTIGPYSKISGSLYVYKSMKTSFDFGFIGEKLKVIGDFDTLRGPDEWSSLQGRIYIFGDKGHRYIYGNKIVLNRYEIIQEKYPGLIGKIDVILKYSFPEEKILHINNQISLFENDLKSQKKRLINLSKKSPESQTIIRIKEEIYDTYNSMFQYISTYIESENWDIKEFKKIKREEFTKLHVFLNQFHGNIKDIEIYNH